MSMMSPTTKESVSKSPVPERVNTFPLTEKISVAEDSEVQEILTSISFLKNSPQLPVKKLVKFEVDKSKSVPLSN